MMPSMASWWRRDGPFTPEASSVAMFGAGIMRRSRRLMAPSSKQSKPAGQYVPSSQLPLSPTLALLLISDA